MITLGTIAADCESLPTSKWSHKP